MAFFALEFGLSPADYWNLTIGEREAFVHIYQQKHKRK